MREIKFRAWIGGEMTYFSFPDDYTGYMSAIWMLYTGLKDKHGREIYEGDILYRNQWKVPLDESHKAEYAVVEFIQGEFRAKRTDKDTHGSGVYYFCQGNPTPFEVIGNIYENPDLLSAKQNDV